jgi:hypothetical protein
VPQRIAFLRSERRTGSVFLLPGVTASFIIQALIGNTMLRRKLAQMSASEGKVKRAKPIGGPDL